MKQPLIYKYRPQTLNDYIIDTKLIELLYTLIKIDNLNILLIGNMGCGKTSILNCLIKEYYIDNYDNNNVLSINSLKEQGISYYRNEVIHFCQTICEISNKKKIITLDDIDIINEQSQQVFRNCIDKYHMNVHFIATCSNTQKVIDSIQSRLLIINIQSVENIHIEHIITKISKAENIMISEEAKQFIISIANNSIRTIINYIEKFKLISNNITYDMAVDMCTNVSFHNFIIYTNLCKYKQNIIDAVQLIYKISDNGYSVIDILDSYYVFVKLTNILNENEKYLIIKLLCKYIIVFFNIHENDIELALFTNNLIGILSK